MQARFRLPILLLVSSLIVLSSCSKKTNKEGRYVPKTAAVVFILNGESLSAKLPWEEIKQNELFKDMNDEFGQKMKAVLDNPDNTGIDIKKNILFFVQKDSLGGYIAVEGTLKDAAKFKEFSNSIDKDAVETQKEDIHFLKTNKATSSWDKEKFVIVIDVPQMNETNRNRFRNNDDSSFSPAPVVNRDANIAAANIYSLAEDNSLANDEKFSDLVGTNGDLHFWANVSAFTSGNKGMAALSMLNMSKLYESSFFTGVANFDNGKINVDFKSYSGKELSDLYKKYSGATINTDMIKRIPAKELSALFAISFKPEGLKEFIKLTGMDGFINVGAAQFGFTFDDFIKANKGDILVSVSDIKKDSNGIPKVNAMFAASIADKSSFGKLVEAGNKLGKEKLGEAAGKTLFYNLSDNYFAIGTDKNSVDKFISTANNGNFDFVDKASGASSLFYFNIPSLVSSMGNETTRDSLDNILFQTTIKTWENMIVIGNGFKDGASNMHMEINLTDKTTNSLKQLNKYLGTMGSIQKQKKANMDKWMNNAAMQVDTVPPPPAN